MGEDDVLFGRFDIRAELRLVWSMIIKGAAQAHQCHLRIGESLLHLIALCFAEMNFNPMRVSRPQLDAFEPGFLAVANDGRDVPIFSEVICYQTDPHSGFA